MTPLRGAVYLVGAGPGDPELITLRGLKLLERADVVVHDRLIARELLRRVRSDATVIDVGKSRGVQRLSQEEINRLLVDHARRGHCVVRLKGGDPFVFGRGFEELTACREAGVDCMVIPGVSSAVAAPLAAGIPVTLRGVARSFAVLTTETADNEETAIDGSTLQGLDTLVFLMGRHRLRQVARDLMAAGRDPHTPVACIERATTPHQRVVTGTLADIAEAADRAGLCAPMVAVVGEVAALTHSAPPSALDDEYGSNSPLNHQISPSPLAGKRILITRPRSTARELARRLSEAGATPIVCPMIRIVYPGRNEALDRAIRELHEYCWVVFGSVHGVRAFWRRLAVLGLDARRLGGCKIAAIGPATCRELRRHGVTPDAAPEPGAVEELVNAIIDQGGSDIGRVLFPCSNIARTTLPEALRAAGATVDALIAYSTVNAALSEDALGRIRRGVDSVIFCSPSAVRRFVELRLNAGEALVVCIGSTTADAARDAGLGVDAVAAEHSNEGLIAALSRCFLVEASA